MKYLDDYDELNEKRQQKTKYEIFHTKEDKLKTSILKSKGELEILRRNDSEDSNDVRELKKEIKIIEVQILELEATINNLRHKKDFISNRLKVTKKREKDAK